MALRTRHLRPLFLMGIAAQTSCSERVEALPEITLSPRTLMVGEVLADRPELLDDTLGFASAQDIVAVDGGYYVVDTGNDRLVLLDRHLKARGVLGRTGSGPGELEIPVWARPTADGIAVAETSNGRISEFDAGGAFLRSTTLPVPVAAFDAWIEGGFLVATAGPTPLAMITADGVAHPFGPARSEDPASSLASRNGVAVAPGGRVLVVDDEAGVIRAFEPDGTPAGAVALPAILVEPIRAGHQDVSAVFEAQGRRVLSQPLVKATATQPDGQVLLLMATDRFAGLLVDPATLGGSLLEVPDPEGVWTRVLSATAGVVEEGTITVVHPGGVTTFVLSASGS